VLVLWRYALDFIVPVILLFVGFSSLMQANKVNQPREKILLWLSGCTTGMAIVALIITIVNLIP